MKSLLGLLIYRRGQKPVPATHHYLYAAVANRRIRTGAARGDAGRTLATQVVEIGFSTQTGPPTERLLGGGKAINVARLYGHKIDCVHYIELARIPAANPLTANNFENVLTRWLCMASHAWPIGNQSCPYQYLETGMAHRVANDPTADRILSILKRHSNQQVRDGLDCIRDVFRSWKGGPCNVNTVDAPVEGLRQEVPVRTVANPIPEARPTAVRLNLTPGAAQDLDRYNGIEGVLFKKVRGEDSFRKLADTYRGMNADANTTQESLAIHALNTV